MEEERAYHDLEFLKIIRQERLFYIYLKNYACKYCFWENEPLNN